MKEKLTEAQIAVVQMNAALRLDGRILVASVGAMQCLVADAVAAWNAQALKPDEFEAAIPAEHTCNGQPINLAFPIASSLDFCSTVISQLDGLADGDPETVFTLLRHWAQWQGACAEYDSPYFTALLAASMVLPAALSGRDIDGRLDSAIRRYSRIATPGIIIDGHGRLIVPAVLPLKLRTEMRDSRWTLNKSAPHSTALFSE